MTFSKGNPGGPGRPRIISKELQAVLDTKKAGVKQLVNKYLTMSQSQMAHISEDQIASMPLEESWIMKLIEKGHNDGNAGLLFHLWEIVVGPLVSKDSLTEEERMALALYAEFKREYAARLNAPSVGAETTGESG